MPQPNLDNKYKIRCEIYFQDKSDENNCEKVIIDGTYQNFLPPPTEKQDKFIVKLSIEVKDIQDIEEMSKTFQVPFTLFLSWFDSRLQFKDLKEDEGFNLLSENEKSAIWKPKVLFKNTNEKHKTKVDQETYIKIKQYGDYSLTTNDNA